MAESVAAQVEPPSWKPKVWGDTGVTRGTDRKVAGALDSRGAARGSRVGSSGMAVAAAYMSCRRGVRATTVPSGNEVAATHRVAPSWG